MYSKLMLVLAAICVLASGARAADDGLMGYWPFDGALTDASGRGHEAVGPQARYAEGTQGRALDPNWNPVAIASHADLQLTPGLVVDCWVYFDKRPENCEQIVLKDKEYQLRVDPLGEGGHFALFVYLNDAWEPRLSGPVPEAGKWYHLVAKWTGSETVLEVNGEQTRTERRGMAVPTNSPVGVGNCTGRVDELRISNPTLAQIRTLRKLADTAGVARSTAAHYGGADGWSGWRGVGEANVQTAAGAISAVLPKATSALASPPLEMDLTGLRYLCADLEAAGARFANVIFITDQGEGSAIAPVWDNGRAAVVDLGPSPLWRGKLRLLAFSLQDPAPGAKLALRNVWVSRRPEGRPYLYVRSLAPECALPRAGRTEKIFATLRSLGKAAVNVTATLVVPTGVRVIGPATQTLPAMDDDATEVVSWTVKADRPVKAALTVRLAADGFGPVDRRLAVNFTPSLNLPKASYVPVPRPAKPDFLTLMHYCPLWKEGTHYGWGKIEPWPERRPAIGFYNEGTPEVADWHIKMALEHGIDGFIYCWYRSDFSPEIHESIGHATHDGLLKSKYLDKFNFTIMWENGCACGCKGREDLLKNLMPYWIEKFFKQPSYVKIDNKPLLYIWVPNWVTRDLGGSENVKSVFNEMREMCKQAGFDGLWIVGCVGTADRVQLERMGKEGWDASSAYGLIGATDKPDTRDVEGMAVRDYASSTLNQEKIWRGKRALGALPDITDVMQGWDPRPWHGAKTNAYYAPTNVAVFEQTCRNARKLIEETPGNGLDKRVMVFDNWCEFGEGHFLEPTAGDGFAYLDAIKRVFAPKSPPCRDITPRDVGLAYPESNYLTRKAILGGLPGRERQVVGDLIAWWGFEDDDAMVSRDQSNCGFHGIKGGFRSAPGKVGKGFLCDGGSVAIGPHRLLTPEDGISVEMWV
ncbi:MAG: glycoside hydrolase family 99-like domain-containing protein, partial [Armatimonadota bacterium]